MEDSLGSDDLLKDVFPDVRVDGTEGVVQEVDVCLLVDCSRQTHPLLLTSAQVDPLTCVHVCLVTQFTPTPPPPPTLTFCRHISDRRDK